MIPDNIIATNNHVRLLAENIVALKDALADLQQSLALIEGRLVKSEQTISALVAYMDQIRDKVNVGPMFPADPEQDAYLYDKRTDTQYVFHKAQDEQDTDYWFDLDD